MLIFGTLDAISSVLCLCSLNIVLIDQNRLEIFVYIMSYFKKISLLGAALKSYNLIQKSVKITQQIFKFKYRRISLI